MPDFSYYCRHENNGQSVREVGNPMELHDICKKYRDDILRKRDEVAKVEAARYYARYFS